MDEQVRQRRLRRLLRVTFPNEKVLCYKSATMTFVEALQMIETDRLPEVKLESYHLHFYLRRFIHGSRRLSWAPRYVACFRCNTLDTSVPMTMMHTVPDPMFLTPCSHG